MEWEQIRKITLSPAALNKFSLKNSRAETSIEIAVKM